MHALIIIKFLVKGSNFKMTLTTTLSAGMQKMDTNTLSEDQSKAAWVKVAENNNVLKCAQNYLQLSESFAQKAAEYVAPSMPLPADLAGVEHGVSVMCTAYAAAKSKQNAAVCDDIEKQIKSLSGFYQKKVAQAYFSASNILLDAHDSSAEILKMLVTNRDSLKELHLTWPTDEDDSNLPNFLEKVAMYERDSENSIHPEKRTVRVPLMGCLPSNFATRQRTA